jgi:hypothetical protein
MTDYQQKYLIYKKKYLMLQEQLAGYYNQITVRDLLNKITLTSSDSSRYQSLVNLLRSSEIKKDDGRKDYFFSFNDMESAKNLAEILYHYNIYGSNILRKTVRHENNKYNIRLKLQDMIVLVKILLRNKANFNEETVMDNGMLTSKFNISADVDSPVYPRYGSPRRVVGNSYISPRRVVSRSPYISPSISPSIISIPNLPLVYSDSSSDRYPYGLPAVPYGLPLRRY